MGVEQIIIFTEKEHWREESFQKILETLEENYKLNDKKILFFPEYLINEKDIQEILLDEKEKTNCCFSKILNFLLSDPDRISIYPIGVDIDGGNERRDNLYKKFASIYDKINTSNSNIQAFILIGDSYKDYFFKRIRDDYYLTPIIFPV